MNKIKVLIVNVLLIAAMIMYNNVFVIATKWIKLKPEEVNERADVIVFGKYDFSMSKKQMQQYKDIFSPIMFKVDKYYRGSGSQLITTGIDMFDTGWVKEVQEEGASFLLFLEHDKENNEYLIPVAGPNGMIQIVNNKAKTGNKDEDDYFNYILLNNTARLPGLKISNWILIIGCILLVIFSIFIIIRRFNKTKHRH